MLLREEGGGNSVSLMRCWWCRAPGGRSLCEELILTGVGEGGGVNFRQVRGERVAWGRGTDRVRSVVMASGPLHRTLEF